MQNVKLNTNAAYVPNPEFTGKRLFLVGCPRSGTTLLQALISRHLSVATFPETKFFHDLIFLPEIYEKLRHGVYSRTVFAYWRRILLWKLRIPSARGLIRLNIIADLLNLPQITTCETLNTRSARAMTDLFVGMLDTAARQNCFAWWLEKTPDHVDYIPVITQLIPDAKFIHIIRPGKAVIASLFDASIKYKDEHWGKVYSDLDYCITRWVNATKMSISFENHRNHIIILYNNVAMDPHNQLSILTDKFQLPRKVVTSDAPQNFILENEPWKNEVHNDIQIAESKFDSIFSHDQKLYIMERLKKYPKLQKYV